jgi:AcrR family transcriptional regulator
VAVRDKAKEDGRAVRAPAKADAAERARADILDVAQRVFSEKGLSGARIDEIADLTRTSKRMIYYYFGSKEGLYRAVLEESYRRIRAIESDLELEALPPLKALEQLVRFTFEYENAHEDFIRLVMVENIHRAEHLKSLPDIGRLNSGAIEHLRDICARGAAEGVMRPDVDPLDLHMTISALCLFNVSNRHTMSTIFKLDVTSKAALARRREAVVDLVLRSVAASGR